MAIVELKSVSKFYGNGASRTRVLNNTSLRVAEGEFLAIVGFSGSGKTTLINLMAGLVAPDAGEVLFKGRPIKEPGRERAVVFQNYSLMPWLTAADNVALAVDAVFADRCAAERRTRVARYIDMVGLSHAGDRRPAELSGGMRQRVAVARALAMEPEVLLLDEPLSALDALTRARLQDEIEDIWAQEKKTVVMITNDVDEAILLADRIVPLAPGPDATLGPEFLVPFARPRARSALNGSPVYKTLRAAVTQYLMDCGRRRATVAADGRQLPKVVPLQFDHAAPRAYAKAADTPYERRYVEFYEVCKDYSTPNGPLTVVDGFDLLMRKGEFVSLIGHSGCGKSTVLSMAAGLCEATSGGIVLDNKEVTTAGPDRAVVFQSPSLLPWMTSRQNVALGVDRVYPHAARAERDDIVSYYLSRVGLSDAMDKRAAELSNGMKQRVGIARAFALSPKLLLLDEPFGMLDALTRWELQEVLMEVWSRTQVTAICVTHDVDEAILLADRVVMMTNGPKACVGRVMAVDIPRPRTRRALLEHPRYYEYRQELLTFLADCAPGAGSRDTARAAAA
ncbi:MAG TPA: nitrate ABC transporter ATP-binding protein [Xanthobacteraceae bacterium]|jgi:nitrate/nitrite transport system ATP-binding protein